MSSSVTPQFSRTPIYVSLGLAVALVIAALVGARVVYDRAGNQPVAMSSLPASQADSPECAAFVDSLPDRLIGHRRAEIADPVPPGAAAWQSSSIERVTLRCGVDLPFQYTELSQTEDVDGVQWLRVDDMTPESTMSTWYSVNRSPVVAVTADEPALGRAENPVSELGDAVRALPEHDAQPHPAPLAELEAAPETETATCGPLLAALPETLADAGWTRAEVSGEDTAAWVREGAEPVVLRCGVAPPPNYEPGGRITQIDDIPWFEDSQLVNGSTASIWYALGRSTDVALSVPQAASAQVLPELGRVIADQTPAE